MAIFVLGMFADIQKERGILPVTRPTYRGSGIALIVRTSNAEAHADMYINNIDAVKPMVAVCNMSDITYP